MEGSLDLLSKRLLVVSGKGGVGKTVVSSALALLAARAGKNVLIVKIDDHGRLAQLFGCEAVGDRIRPVHEGISAVNLDAKTVVADYIYAQLRIRRLVRHIVDSQLFEAWFRVSPAIKEMILLGKVYSLVGEKSWWRQRAVWDLIVFDAPATGHGLGLLQLPAQASSLLIGPMRQNALAVKDLLENPESTGVVLVTLPEEMPVTEAIHFADEARRSTSVPLACLVLNQAFLERVEPAELERLPALLEQAPTEAAWRDLGGQGPPAPLAAAADRALARGAMTRRHRATLRERIEAPLVEVPYVFAEQFGFRELERVAANLAQGLAPTTGRADDGAA